MTLFPHAQIEPTWRPKRGPRNKPVQMVPLACECGNHYFAPLTKGFVTLVSPCDAYLLTRKWVAFVGPRAVQVARAEGEDRKTTLLSRLIMEPKDGLVVDHKNCDPTDNRRENLRLCSPAENARNRRKERGSNLPKGVRASQGRFYASVMVHGKRHPLGGYATAEEAHAAYVAGAERLHGEFARAA